MRSFLLVWRRLLTTALRLDVRTYGEPTTEVQLAALVAREPVRARTAFTLAVGGLLVGVASLVGATLILEDGTTNAGAAALLAGASTALGGSWFAINEARRSESYARRVASLGARLASADTVVARAEPYYRDEVMRLLLQAQEALDDVGAVAEAWTLRSRIAEFERMLAFSAEEAQRAAEKRRRSSGDPF